MYLKLLSSPLVLTWTMIFSFSTFLSLIQEEFKASASFTESTVSTMCRFGTESSLFTLFLCKWPIKCQQISGHFSKIYLGIFDLLIYRNPNILNDGKLVGQLTFLPIPGYNSLQNVFALHHKRKLHHQLV